MSLLLNFIGGASLTSPPETDIPVGSPSVNIINDILLVANQPSQDNRWYGRPVLKRLPDNIWVMVYANSEAHNLLTWSQLHVKFTDDYGETWSDEDKYLDGNSITGFPMYPPGSTPGANTKGPGEPWLYVCPNGDILCHMWNTIYNGTDDGTFGTYQSRSTDGGKNWTTPAFINFIGIANDRRIYATDDNFVLNGVIYAGARVYNTDDVDKTQGIKSIFIKSTDNGLTWDYVSDVTTIGVTDSTEYGMEYIGNNTIVAFIRYFVSGEKTYLRFSDNMGLTWGAIQEIQSTVEPSGRQRVYTRSHIKGTENWWTDPVLICHGFVFTAASSGQPRRLAVWASKDHGSTWSVPLWLKDEHFDGGYGDVLYNPLKDEYVTVQYVAPTSLLDGEIRQINWELIWS